MHRFLRRRRVPVLGAVLPDRPVCLRRRRLIVPLLLGLLAMVYILHRQPALPPGVNQRGPLRPVAADDLRLLFDWTARDPETDERVIRQEIFDVALEMIADARRFVVVDFFLWNSWQGAVPETHRSLATELADALMARKAADPDLPILVLSDPINRVYGAQEEAFFRAMAASGIPVVFTDLDRLPDSNLLYAPPARRIGGSLLRLAPLARRLARPRWPNPLDRGGEAVSTRQMARLLLFKANHRKVLIADGPGDVPRVLVTSLNPADGSSAHGNIGLLADGAVALDALESELAQAAWSAARPGRVLESSPGAWQQVAAAIRARQPEVADLPPAGAAAARVAWDSEGAIRRRLIELLDSAGPGDTLMGMVFYLSDRGVVRALQAAAARGARVRLILDPNQDAFGWKKNGIPNRPVAAELRRAAKVGGLPLEIRWAATQGEQFHAKALALHNPVSGRAVLICGSANWTRRNLQNFNLEANLYLENAPGVLSDYMARFEMAWDNRDGLRHTVDYDHHADGGAANWLKTLLYRFQERFGAGSF